MCVCVCVRAQVGVAEGSLLSVLCAQVSGRLGAPGIACGNASFQMSGADSAGREPHRHGGPETRAVDPAGSGGEHLRRHTVVLLTDRKRMLITSCLFVQQSAVQTFPPADGYAFSNTTYKCMQFLEQDAAVAAFKQAVGRRVDR